MTTDNLAYPYTPGEGYNVSLDGTKGKYIHFFAYPGENPILDCSNVNPAKNHNRGIDGGNDVNYIHFKGLTVRNVRQTSGNVSVIGWGLCGDNNIIENCTVHNCGGKGFFGTGHNVKYINCDAYENTDPLDYDMPGNDGVGFTNVDVVNNDGSLYYINCRAWLNGDQGFSAISNGYLEFNGCWSFNNGDRQGEGHGFKMGEVGIPPYGIPFGPLKRKYVNCIAAYNRANGWTTKDGDHPGHRMHIFNNLSFYNGHHLEEAWPPMQYGFAIWTTSSHDSIELAREFYNNISIGNEDGEVWIDQTPHTAVYTHSNNSWDGGVTITLDDFAAVPVNREAGITLLMSTRQSDGSLPDLGNYFKLAEGSDLIDKGYDIGLPYSGSAPDLGPFESDFTGTSPIVLVFSSASVENATPARMDITYNLTLANIVPPASAFAVRVNSVARTVSSVAISGTRVQLTLSSPVVYGDIVTVAYTKPSSNPIQTAAGEQAVSFLAKNVTNNVVAVNKPPSIYLSSPANSSSYMAPATITIDAVASDPDGAVVKVEFYYGTTKLGEVGSSPYSFTWKNVPEGNYKITAVATDNQNQRTVSGAVTVIVEKSVTPVNRSPIITIVSPSKRKNRRYKIGESILIVAEATDPDGTISKVEFKSGSLVLAQVVTNPYSFTFEPADTGVIVITASATDNSGTTTVSDELHLMIVFPTDNFSEYLDLYPNPNNGRFAVEVGSEIPYGSLMIKIVSLSGIVIYEAVMSDQERRKEIDITGSPAGSYILMLVNHDGMLATRKLLKL